MLDYAEHAIGKRRRRAGRRLRRDRQPAAATMRWGVGTDPNIITASLRAVLSAFERQHVVDRSRQMLAR